MSNHSRLKILQNQFIEYNLKTHLRKKYFQRGQSIKHGTPHGKVKVAQVLQREINIRYQVEESDMEKDR